MGLTVVGYLQITPTTIVGGASEVSYSPSLPNGQGLTNRTKTFLWLLYEPSPRNAIGYHTSLNGRAILFRFVVVTCYVLEIIQS